MDKIHPLPRFLALLLDLILPVRCAGCDHPGSSFCTACTTTLTGLAPVRRPGLSAPAYALARYEGAARSAVIAYKERDRRDLAAIFGNALAAALPHLPGAQPDGNGTWWLIPVPSRAAESRRRGGCHLTRLARATAAVVATNGHPAAVAPALRRTGRTVDSVGLSAVARTVNLAGRIHLKPGGIPPPGTPVVLLDDVIASGATAVACTRTLTEAHLEVTAILTLTAV